MLTVTFNILGHTASTPASGCADLRCLELAVLLLLFSTAEFLLLVQVRLEAQAWLGLRASQVSLRVHCHLSVDPP